MAAPSQRTALGALFLLIAAAFAGIAFAAVASGSGLRGWVVGLAAAALALWMGGLAVRALRPR